MRLYQKLISTFSIQTYYRIPCLTTITKHKPFVRDTTIKNLPKHLTLSICVYQNNRRQNHKTIKLRIFLFYCCFLLSLLFEINRAYNLDLIMLQENNVVEKGGLEEFFRMAEK